MASPSDKIYSRAPAAKWQFRLMKHERRELKSGSGKMGARLKRPIEIGVLIIGVLEPRLANRSRTRDNYNKCRYVNDPSDRVGRITRVR